MANVQKLVGGELVNTAKVQKLVSRGELVNMANVQKLVMCVMWRVSEHGECSKASHVSDVAS